MPSSGQLDAQDTSSEALLQRGFELIEETGLLCFRSLRLAELGVPHLFTTRIRSLPGLQPNSSLAREAPPSPPSAWSARALGPQDVTMGFKSIADRESLLRFRRAACRLLLADVSRLTVARQVHSGLAVAVDEGDVGRGAVCEGDTIPDADGLVTDVPGTVLMVLTADCLPVLLCDPKGPVGAFHAGWRGALAGIARSTVALMQKRYGSEPGELVAAFGPAIRSCCFEVGRDVARRFMGHSEAAEPPIAQNRAGRWFVDIAAFVKNELLSSGVAEANITDAGLCTFCLPELFFSYRRSGRLLGSMGALIKRPQTLNGSKLPL